METEYVEFEPSEKDTSTSVKYLNFYRNMMLNNVKTVAIEYVIFDVNTTSRNDEIIALRLGQLVIRKTPSLDLNHRIHVRVKGPCIFTTKQIPLIPFVIETPIMILNKNEELIFDVILNENYGHVHAKYQPVCQVSFDSAHASTSDAVARLKYKNLGMLTKEELKEETMKAVRSYNPETEGKINTDVFFKLEADF